VISFAFILCFELWNRLANVLEVTLPDRYDFGRIYQGSKLEFSARFLTSSKKYPLDQLFEKIQSKLSPSWRDALDKFHPKNFRAEPVLREDLSSVKPKIIAPSFIGIESSRADQRKEWYGGKTFIVLAGHLDTGHTGRFTGEIEVRWNHRKAFLPVSVTIDPPPPTARRLLITETPFDSDSTESGTNFLATIELLARLPLKSDILEALPEHLDEYDTILLAGGTLFRLTPDQIQRLKAFVRKGGCLVLACNAFFSGTIPAANKVASDFGLQVLDKELNTNTSITNIVPDVLTKDVRSVTFHRPSPIEADPLRAKLLLLNQDGTGYAAVARTDGGGELVILTQSLWWWWLQQFRDQSDNSRFLRNILVCNREH